MTRLLRSIELKMSSDFVAPFRAIKLATKVTTHD